MSRRLLNGARIVNHSAMLAAILQPKCDRRRISTIWRSALINQRGISSLLFAGSMVGFLGMVGLGTEAGSWYLARRHGQNAADAAAMAGALMLASTSSSQAVQAASAGNATSNGYTTGGGVSVSVYTPPQSGSYAGNASAVQVVIAQPVTPHFMALFIQPFSINTSAVASLVTSAPACVLALNQISLGGNGGINAPNCAVASNGTASNAISTNGNPSVTARDIITSGGCSGNGQNPVCSGSNVRTYQPPTSNPFANTVAAVPVPSFGGSSCTAANKAGSALTPYANSQGSVTGTAYCNGTVSLKGTVTLAPGTYYFYNASLSFSANASVTCPLCTDGQGVTIIFAGSSPGTISVGANANVTLSAPTINNYNSAFDALLFYSPTSSAVDLSGNATLTLSGAMYFPNASVTYGGTSGSTASCSILVANNVTLQGTPSLDDSGCPPSVVPQARNVRLVG